MNNSKFEPGIKEQIKDLFNEFENNNINFMEYLSSSNIVFIKSIAISLKRIADALEKPKEQTNIFDQPDFSGALDAFLDAREVKQHASRNDLK